MELRPSIHMYRRLVFIPSYMSSLGKIVLFFSLTEVVCFRRQLLLHMFLSHAIKQTILFNHPACSMPLYMSGLLQLLLTQFDFFCRADLKNGGCISFSDPRASYHVRRTYVRL